MALPIVAKFLEGAGKIKETGQNLLKDKEIPNTEKVKTTLLQQAMETNKDKIEAVRNAIENQENNNESDNEGNDNSEKKGLSEEEKAKIKEETGWSDEIIDAIGSWEEYEIYKKAGIKDISIKLYKNDRHELINETDKEDVYDDIRHWLICHL